MSSDNILYKASAIRLLLETLVLQYEKDIDTTSSTAPTSFKSTTVTSLAANATLSHINSDSGSTATGAVTAAILDDIAQKHASHILEIKLLKNVVEQTKLHNTKLCNDITVKATEINTLKAAINTYKQANERHLNSEKTNKINTNQQSKMMLLIQQEFHNLSTSSIQTLKNSTLTVQKELESLKIEYDNSLRIIAQLHMIDKESKANSDAYRKEIISLKDKLTVEMAENLLMREKNSMTAIETNSLNQSIAHLQTVNNHLIDKLKDEYKLTETLKNESKAIKQELQSQDDIVKKAVDEHMNLNKQ